MAIVASALDSLLDLVAGAILWFTKWSMQRINKYKYPIGKSRMQPVGIVVFAAIMTSLGKVELYDSVQYYVNSTIILIHGIAFLIIRIFGLQGCK